MSGNLEERQVPSMTFERVRECAPVLEAMRAYATVHTLETVAPARWGRDIIGR